MKNVVAILLLIGLLIPSFSFGALEVKQDTIKTATTEKQKSIKKGFKAATGKQYAETASDTIAEEQRKKDIEDKEHSVNKNKKVRRFGVDENLSNIIQKRNIP